MMPRTLVGRHRVRGCGAYEKLQGHIVFRVDPKRAANRQIADLGLAPRDAGRQDVAAIERESATYWDGIVTGKP